MKEVVFVFKRGHFLSHFTRHTVPWGPACPETVEGEKKKILPRIQRAACRHVSAGMPTSSFSLSEKKVWPPTHSSAHSALVPTGERRGVDGRGGRRLGFHQGKQRSRFQKTGEAVVVVTERPPTRAHQARGLSG